jgi:hypothetical protein
VTKPNDPTEVAIQQAKKPYGNTISVKILIDLNKRMAAFWTPVGTIQP